MRSCTNLCCTKSRCDLAIVLNDQCFALACFTPVLCEMTRAFSETYKPKMSYILKSGDYEDQPRRNGKFFVNLIGQVDILTFKKLSGRLAVVGYQLAHNVLQCPYNVHNVHITLNGR